MQTVARSGHRGKCDGMTRLDKKRTPWAGSHARPGPKASENGREKPLSRETALPPCQPPTTTTGTPTTRLTSYPVRTWRQATENEHTERTQSPWQSATAEIDKNGDQPHVPAAISSQPVACITTIAKRHIRAIQHIMAHHTREGSITGARSRAESPSVVVRQFFIW